MNHTLNSRGMGRGSLSRRRVTQKKIPPSSPGRKARVSARARQRKARHYASSTEPSYEIELLGICSRCVRPTSYSYRMRTPLSSPLPRLTPPPTPRVLLCSTAEKWSESWNGGEFLKELAHTGASSDPVCRLSFRCAPLIAGCWLTMHIFVGSGTGEFLQWTLTRFSSIRNICF